MNSILPFSFSRLLCHPGRLVIGSLLALITMCEVMSAAAESDLERGFEAPPDTARPLTWWHWMNGNVTSEGIKADLRWMKRAGISGVQYVDVGLDIPQYVQDPVHYLSPQWQAVLKEAVSEAVDLDLEFGVFSSPGWSLSGGPWVQPEQAMKKVVWSTSRVRGGSHFVGKLPDLPRVTGPFQNVPASPGWLENRGAIGSLPEFSGESAVLAFPVPAGFDNLAGGSRVTSSVGRMDGRALVDGDVLTGLPLPGGGSKKKNWLQLELPRVSAIRSLTVSLNIADVWVNVQVSDNGKTFKPLEMLYVGAARQVTASFEPVNARYFRFIVSSPRRPAVPAWHTALPGADTSAVEELIGVGKLQPTVEITEIGIYEGGRVNQVESKAAFTISGNYYDLASPFVPEEFTVDPFSVIDLTGKVAHDGTLDWQAPRGEWIVLRLGYSLVGNLNHAASLEGTGLEVDKLNARHVTDYLEDYLETYAPATGGKAGELYGISTLMADSIEVGLQNWTEDILEQFERLRGYDPRPWLPTLIGFIVRDAAASDRFLWDFRRTISDLIGQSHYRILADVANSRGLTFYGEALEGARFSLGDDMEMRRHADVPTAAIWALGPSGQIGPATKSDIGGAASVANIYGQNLVAAEMFTSALAPWSFAPRHLKPASDIAFALGVNRPIIHSSVHQPLDDFRPGMSLSVFGLYLNRHETWAELVRPWTDYLARCAYLLQQGQVVSDIAYFYGEEAPLVTLFGLSDVEGLPAGYTHDFVNSDVVLNHLSVHNGDLVTETGMRYRAIYLGGTSSRMTLPVLRKLQELVAQGAVVVGEMPVGSPSLADDPEEFERVARELFSTVSLKSPYPSTSGRVFQGKSLEAVFDELGIRPDFTYPAGPDFREKSVMFRHRRTSSSDIYFVANPSAETLALDASFRVTGKVPEIWNPDTGLRENISWSAHNGTTSVPLRLLPYQSLFVVFRGATSRTFWQLEPDPAPVRRPLEGQWQLTFSKSDDAPLDLLELKSWTEMGLPHLKYFSGTARYKRSINIPPDWLERDGRIFLDLGKVREIAQVSINDEPLGILWKPPYRIDLAKSVKPGLNTLEVAVTNLWVNALVGGVQPDAVVVPATGVPTYTADAELQESGLIGPVALEYESRPN